MSDGVDDSELARAWDALRALVNDNRRIKERLMRRGANWSCLTAALDSLDDADLALSAADEVLAAAATRGTRYVAIYGLLQALYIQQNAVMSWYRVVCGRELVLPERVEEIRLVRHECSGHPEGYAAFLVAVSVTTREPYYVLMPGDRSLTRKDLDFEALIADQRKLLAPVVQELVTELHRQDIEHMKTHVHAPLIDAAARLHAASRDVQQHLWKPSDNRTTFLGISTSLVGPALGALHRELTSLMEYQASDELLRDPIAQVGFCLGRLSKFARASSLEGDDHREARAYARELEHAVASLVEYCESVAAEYEDARTASQTGAALL